MYDIYAMHRIGWDPVVEHSLLCLGCSYSFVFKWFVSVLSVSSDYLLSGLLEKTPAEANAFLSKPQEYKNAMKSAGDAQARELLERVVECLVTERCVSFEDCISWARTRYNPCMLFVLCIPGVIYIVSGS